MPLSDTQQKTRIKTKYQAYSHVGMRGQEAADEAAFAVFLDLVWSEFDDQPNLDPRLQALYAERECIEYLLGNRGTRDIDVKSATGAAQANSQRVKTLQGLLENVTNRIKRIERGFQVAVGDILTKTPEGSTENLSPDLPNPYDRRYRGDPLRRS